MSTIKPADPLLLRGLTGVTQPTAGKGAEKAAEMTPEMEKIDKAARQFEGMLLHEMLKSMWSTVPQSELFKGSGNEDEMYRDFMNQAVSDTISAGRGIGIRDVVTKDMQKLDKYKQKQ